MKFVIMAVGKTATPHIREGIDMYLKRLVHYIPVDINIIPDVKSAKNLTEAKQKEMEGQQMLNLLMPGDYVVLLDEKGKEFTSRQFADHLDRKMNSVPKRVVFIIGGPYGFSEQVYGRANEKLSLSKMTFNHEMVRLFFVEQIYRAMTILRGEPYHHD